MGNIVAGLGFGNMMGASTLAAGANTIGSVYATNEAEKEAAANRDFQQGMSGTAHQREVADLQAAGLNPMLSAMHSGASTPAGAVGNIAGGNPAAAGTEALMSGITTGANVAVANATADKLTAEAAESRARTPTYGVSIDQMRQSIEQSKSTVENLQQLTRTSAASAQEIAERTANAIKARDVMDTTMQQMRAQTHLSEQEIKNKTAEEREIIQRVKANLPSLEALWKEVQTTIARYDVPRARQQQEVHTGGSEMLGRFASILNVILRGK